MNKSKLAVVISTLLLASASVAAVDKELCYQTPTGEWICEPVMQPMGPGSGGTGGPDDELPPEEGGDGKGKK